MSGGAYQRSTAHTGVPTGPCQARKAGRKDLWRQSPGPTEARCLSFVFVLSISVCSSSLMRGGQSGLWYAPRTSGAKSHATVNKQLRNRLRHLLRAECLALLSPTVDCLARPWLAHHYSSIRDKMMRQWWVTGLDVLRQSQRAPVMTGHARTGGTVETGAS